jgi:CRP-like cAMP-binding protein
MAGALTPACRTLHANRLRSSFNGLPGEIIDELVNENIIALRAAVSAVSAGSARRCSDDGRRFLVELAGPGDIIGYVDRLDGKGRHCQAFEAQALTNCAMALVSRHRILKLLTDSSQAKVIALFERLDTFWGSMVHRYASIMTLSYRERLEAMLSEVGARFGVREARGTMLTLELGHDDWAETIGSSRPMVSRLIAEMVQNRMLAREGKHYILLDNAGSEKPGVAMPRIEAPPVNGAALRRSGAIARPARVSS